MHLKKKKLLLLLIPLGIILIIFSAYLILSRRNKATLTKTTGSDGKIASGSSTFLPVATADVYTTKDGFFPATLSITKGQKVTFLNADTLPHQPASDPHPTHEGYPGFECPEPLEANETYSFTFEKAGDYSYHDHLNPLTIKGTIIVR